MAKKKKDKKAEKELRKTQWEQQQAGIIDYDVYIMSKKENIINIIFAYCIIFIVGMIFYHNPILAALLGLFAFKFPKIRTNSIIKKRKSSLTIQFKDLLYSVSSSMEAGRSIEAAFKDALRDMAIIYPNPETPIMKETVFIVRKIEMNEPVEQALLEFAKRSHIDDIENFADIISVCKRTGGNLAEVVRNTSQVIGDKIETKREIETTITSKKFESRIMSVMPIAMVFLLSVSSPEFMEPVFTTITGNIVMTIAIFMFTIAFFVSEKIVDIEV